MPVPIQVVEFVAFGEQLSRSHTKAAAQTELCLLDLALHASKCLGKIAAANSENIAVPGMPCNHLQCLPWIWLAAVILLKRHSSQFSRRQSPARRPPACYFSLAHEQPAHVSFFANLQPVHFQVTDDLGEPAGPVPS